MGAMKDFTPTRPCQPRRTPALSSPAGEERGDWAPNRENESRQRVPSPPLIQFERSAERARVRWGMAPCGNREA